MKKSIKKIIIPILLVFVFLGVVLFFTQKERGCQKVYVKDGELVVYSDSNKILEWQNRSPADEWAEVASDAGYYFYKVSSMVEAHGGKVIHVDSPCVDIIYNGKTFHREINDKSSVFNYFYPSNGNIYEDYFEIEGATVFVDFKGESDSFIFEVKTHCFEGILGCDYVTLSLTDRKNGTKKQLKGKDIYRMNGNTPVHFLGYLFKDGSYEYFISDNKISVKREGKEILEEDFLKRYKSSKQTQNN